MTPGDLFGGTNLELGHRHRIRVDKPERPSLN